MSGQGGAEGEEERKADFSLSVEPEAGLHLMSLKS